ncbi:MAG: hypothetical protein GXO09_06015 [Crenarchaeota archaeon]|nr:hypothetical protein [Thermoproteota archaeon]
MTRRREYIRSIARQLLQEEDLYDRDGCLNSDGRKLLNLLIRQAAEEKPWLTRAAQKARRNPCREEVARLIARILEEV